MIDAGERLQRCINAENAGIDDARPREGELAVGIDREQSVDIRQQQVLIVARVEVADRRLLENDFQRGSRLGLRKVPAGAALLVDDEGDFRLRQRQRGQIRLAGEKLAEAYRDGERGCGNEAVFRIGARQRAAVDADRQRREIEVRPALRREAAPQIIRTGLADRRHSPAGGQQHPANCQHRQQEQGGSGPCQSSSVHRKLQKSCRFWAGLAALL